MTPRNRHKGPNISLVQKISLASLAIFCTSLLLYSAGDVYYLDVDPMVANTLPGHEVVVNLTRPERGGQAEVEVRLESMDPEVAEVPGAVVFRSGVLSVPVTIRALRAGPANIRASADQHGDVIFSVNVLDDSNVHEQVTPTSIALRLGRGESANVTVADQLPAASIPEAVDLAFTVDARPSFADASARLTAAFPQIISNLKTVFPAVTFAASVSKFQDYGGPGAVFRIQPPSNDAQMMRPFVLLVPNTSVDTAAGVTAVQNALATNLPGDDAAIVASYLEALRQIAQGSGFDGDNNGARTDSGAAGVAGSSSQVGFLNPGLSGDVPPFSTKPASIPSAGTLGGVGFRVGTQRIVLLATNTYPVGPLDRARPFPTEITGFNDVSVPITVFQEVFTYPAPGTFGNTRFGPLSATVSTLDPANSVAPLGAVTIPEVFPLLAGQGIQVASFFSVSQPAPTGLIDPKPVLSDIARLTGAFDSDRVPLTFELIGANADDVAGLFVEAIRQLITQPRVVTLRAVGNDAGFGFSFTPPSVTVAPGGRAEFQTTITGTGAAGGFEIQFVTETGVILGRIPVTITLPGPTTPTVSGINPTSGPIGTVVTITGTNFSTTPANNVVTFGSIAAPVTAATATTITTAVPPGSVAGPTDVSVRVAGQTSNTFSFRVLHTINSLSPTSGPAGTVFTIQGSAFASGTAGNTVTFGGTAATIQDATNTQIRGAVPNITPGPYPVQVTTNGVTTNAGTFTVTPSAPTITGIVPSSGPAGTLITITGTGFSTTATDNVITFTDVQTGQTTTVPVTAASSTQLQLRVPDLVAGQYRVTASRGGLTSAPVNFTLTPFISSVTPATATLNSQLQITGTGFSPDLSQNVVTLNGVEVPVQAGSTAGTLLVTVPLNVRGTSLAVQVTTRGVPSNTVSVALSPAPVVCGVSGIFETRERIVITLCGADPGGDLTTVGLTIQDGEGQTLGNFDSINIASLVASQSPFNIRIPLDGANHFTAAMRVSAVFRDASGNSSNTFTGVIINPDIRPVP